MQHQRMSNGRVHGGRVCLGRGRHPGCRFDHPKLGVVVKGAAVISNVGLSKGAVGATAIVLSPPREA